MAFVPEYWEKNSFGSVDAGLWDFKRRRLLNVKDTAVTRVSHRYDSRSEGFWLQLHAGDETWVDDFETESKQQFMEWRHTTSTRKKKLKSVPSTGKNAVTCVTVMNVLPGCLADILQGQHCTNDETLQRNNFTEWEMHGFVRAKKTVLENDGLQVCFEAQ
jgi:hypothetical protein